MRAICRAFAALSIATAQKHHQQVKKLQERSESGSLASLRLSTFRRRIEPGRFEVGFEATKDKRRGRRWTFTLTCDGAPGLR